MSQTTPLASEQDYIADIQRVIDGVFHKYAMKSVDPCEYFKDDIDQCVSNINSIGLKKRRDQIFQNKVDIGNYLLKLNDKCEQAYLEWTPILNEVSVRTGDDIRQLQRFMRVAREKNLDKKHYSRGFTHVENYIAATRSVDNDLDINLVLESIEKDDTEEDRRKNEATKVASKLMVDEKYSDEFESNEIDNIKSIINSQSGVNYEKVVDAYRDIPESGRDEYTEGIVLSGSNVSTTETVENEENISSVLIRIKSDLNTVIDSEQDFSDIDEEIFKKIKFLVESCSAK